MSTFATVSRWSTPTHGPVPASIGGFWVGSKTAVGAAHEVSSVPSTYMVCVDDGVRLRTTVTKCHLPSLTATVPWHPMSATQDVELPPPCAISRLIAPLGVPDWPSPMSISQNV